MGCDGGTIPKRHELVKTAKKPEQKDRDMDRRAKWSTCSISQQVLSKPIVACELGKLYNKESILEFLLDRTICETAPHIRSLKDIKVLNLTPNPGYKKDSSQLADQYADNQVSKFVCPVVGLEMNGKYKFCVLWSCGCVLSERALREVDTETCHNCGMKFTAEDVILLNPEGGDIDKMNGNMWTRREKLKVMKKNKKNKGREKRKGENHVTEDTHKVNGDFQAPKPVVNGNISGKDQKSKQESDEKTTVVAKKTKLDRDESKKTGYIDPKQSQVYKNLFISSEPKRNKDKTAHWITYNPYHL